MKFIVPCIVAALICSIFIGCASSGGKKKSNARLYEGDTSPNIRMYTEKPGYPLNPL